MADNIPAVTIIAGEASGDLHGAHLAARLRAKLPEVKISGVGGERMRRAGVELMYDSSTWSAIGVSEAAKVYPRLLQIARKLHAYLKTHPPDVLILIDFGFFNLRIAKDLPAGVKVLYYFPPGSWRKNGSRSQLRGLVDRVVTPFPWSEQTLRAQGVECDFFGHPLLDVAKPTLTADEFHERFGFDSERPIIGLLPGSRTPEIVHILPCLVVAAAKLLELDRALQFAMPLAPSVNAKRVTEELNRIPWIDAHLSESQGERGSGIGSSGRLSLYAGVKAVSRIEGFAPKGLRVRIEILSGGACDVLAYSRAALVTSGTATIEGAMLGCPMVIVYRGGTLMKLEWRLRRRNMNIKFIGMPNIILDRVVCPELILEDASPARIVETASRLIGDTHERREMLRGLGEVRAALGGPGAVDKTAEVVLEMLRQRVGETARG